jgi:leucyl aminopeptidase (aminopeptidase T)
MEKTLLNVGDYSEMKNIGGTFPVGELISELVDLTELNGEMMVFGFADLQKHLQIPDKPFRVSVKSGVVVDYDRVNGPSSFGELLEAIRAEETDIWIREFGLGLNRAMSKTRVVDNITTFERMLGMHVSIGKKHNVFKGRNGSRWHADLFLDLERITVDDFAAYEDGEFHVRK